MQNYKNLSARVLSLALSAAMVFTSFSTTVFAAEEAAPLGVSGALTTDSIITAFDALGEGFEKSEDGHTYLRSVELNTPFEEVGLPTELGVTVKHPTTDTEATATEPAATEPATTEPAATEPAATEPAATEATTTEPAATEPAATEPATTEPVATEPATTEAEAGKNSAPEQNSSATVVADEMIPVTWNGDRDYTPAEDSKVLYTAVLPEGYALADGVKLPTINVMVGKQPMAAIAAMPRAIAIRTEPLDLTASPPPTNPGDQGWTWDAGTKTLTLSGANIDCSNLPVSATNTFAVKLPDGATIELAAGSTSSVKSGNVNGEDSQEGINTYGIETVGNLTINGSGTLIATGGNATASNPKNRSGGIWSTAAAESTITINGGTINATGGNVTASIATSAGIYTEYTVAITDGAYITAEGKALTGTSSQLSAGVSAKALTMTGGVLNGIAGDVLTNCYSNGINPYASMTLSGTAIVTGIGTTSAIESNNPITATGASVTGAVEEFVSGTTTILTQTDPTKPVEISFTKSVSFDARNGAVIPSVTIDKVTHKIDDAAMPANPTWAGYDFGGWYTDVDGKGTAFKNENLTASVTAYAKWTKNGKTVRTEPLDLTGAATNLNGDGWKWDNTAKTLTLDGITLNSSKLDNNNNASGILFPADAPSTIILVDGTENTVDVSAAKGSINNSQAIYATNKLTIKTSGKGTPGKLNAIAGKADGPSFGIYADGGLVIESGNITATAGESVTGNSVGISANLADIHIKGGTVTATGGKSGGTGMAGSFGLYGNNVRIDDGAVTATGGEATTGLKLSAGIVGASSVKLNGGNIHANGNTAAVAALAADGVVIDDITNVTVSGSPAKVGTKNIGVDISTLLDASDAIVTEAVVKFKPNYTGTNTLAPNAYKAIKTHNSITLPTQAVAGETVEYGKKESDGTITWQDSATFGTLNSNAEYTFYTRVKGNDKHKAGTTSAATTIKTKNRPVSVGGTILDSNGSHLVDATVTLKQGNKVIATATTIADGTYVLNDVPGGVYSLVITKGTAPDTVTITETVIVSGSAITGKDIQFLDGKKNTVVESDGKAPEVAVGGMNALLNPTNLNETLKTQEEKDAVAGGGSVDLTFKAEIGSDEDKSAIEGSAAKLDQQIDLLLDLSVQKTVRALGGALVKNEKIPSLAELITVHLPIPAKLQGKTDLSLYRMHAGKAEKLGKDLSNANTDGEYYTIDLSGTFMTLYVKNFSTYALGYSTFPVTIVDGGTGASVSGSGKYSGGDTVTVNAGSKSGYSFDGWTVAPATVILSNPGSATTTFVMPAEAVTVTAVWTSTGGGSGSGSSGGGGSSDDNGEYEFWMQGMDKIDTAKSGDVIKLNLKSNDKMPASVMAALRKNPGVSLVITWNGGKTITIPAGKAPKQEDGRLYYPLSMLAELYAGYTEDSVLKSTAPQNPQTGGPSSFISAAGGELITLEAPTPALTENAQANTITPPDAGFEASAFAGTPDESAAQGTSPIAVAALVLLLAALGGGWVLLWKRDSKEQE